jgi:hypothetical protein
MTAKNAEIERLMPLFRVVHEHEASWREGAPSFCSLSALAGYLNGVLGAENEAELADALGYVTRWVDATRTADVAEPISRAIELV